MRDLLLSLIVCTYRRPLEVARLLEAVGRQSRLPGETLIVDSSPDRGTEEEVRSFQKTGRIPNLKYYAVPPADRGLTRQRNYGVARAGGELVAFLDDDTVLETDYFEEILACFRRHPEAVGVGGYVTNEDEWRQVDRETPAPVSVFRWGKWERREDYRWRMRRLLGLASTSPPGWLSRSGHGRPVAYLPPDGKDYRVEFLMGCSFTWRSESLRRHRFSSFFEGYGLYEDLDFCVRASRDGPLYLCTRARLAHHHAPSGRPNHFRYGEMVVRNGWFVWRTRWPSPPRSSRLRWWATTVLLTLCRLGDVVRGPARRQAFTESVGRAWGMTRLLYSAPTVRGSNEGG